MNCQSCGFDLDGTPAYYDRFCTVRCVTLTDRPKPESAYRKPYHERRGWWEFIKGIPSVGNAGNWGSRGGSS